MGIVLGSLSGLVSALYLTGMTDNGLRRDQPVYVDGWVSDWSIGSEASGRYLKAWVARRGLLAMRKSEAVYFNRSTDNDGAPLRESCRYLVSGADLPGGWWSVTLYDRLSYLPMNTDGHMSYDASAAGPGAWQFEIGPTRPVGDVDWVSSKNGEGFDLTLRIYQPEQAFLDAPMRGWTLPEVQLLSCDTGGSSGGGS